jgi:hypothetical protein
LEKPLRRLKVTGATALKQGLGRLEDVPGASLRWRRVVHRNLNRKAYIVGQHGEQFT